VPNLSEAFFPVYTFEHWTTSDNILFALQYQKKYMENNKLIIHQYLINMTTKSKSEYDWEIDNWKNLKMIQPSIKINGK
jgi:hypothetical protein